MTTNVNGNIIYSVYTKFSSEERADTRCRLEYETHCSRTSTTNQGNVEKKALRSK